MPTHLVATTTLPNVSVGHSLMQMVVALAVIVACIYGLSKVLHRMRSGPSTRKSLGPLRGTRREATKSLSVLSRQPLGKDLSIAAVRWGDQEVLVGIAGSTITFLNGTSSRPDGSGVNTPTADAPSALLAAAAERATMARAGATEDGGRPSLLDALRDATLRH